MRAPHEPAFTVESLAMIATVRPSIVPVPVITPSAGRSPARASLASSASSTNEPGSSSRAMRSRAKSFFCSPFFWWYFGAPPFSMSAILRLRSSSEAMKAQHSAITLNPAAKRQRHLGSLRPTLGRRYGKRARTKSFSVSSLWVRSFRRAWSRAANKIPRAPRLLRQPRSPLQPRLPRLPPRARSRSRSLTSARSAMQGGLTRTIRRARRSSPSSEPRSRPASSRTFPRGPTPSA